MKGVRTTGGSEKKTGDEGEGNKNSQIRKGNRYATGNQEY